MRSGGFTLFETLVVAALITSLYVFFSFNFEARSRAAQFASSLVQARAWADVAEVERQSGVVPSASGVAAPFGGVYSVRIQQRAALLSFDVPFEVRRTGFIPRENNDEGGRLQIAPSVFAPTAAMHEKALLYEEQVR